MSSALTERLIAALKSCPCCRARPKATLSSTDGIPSRAVRSVEFDCGADVYVLTSGDFEARTPCPYPFDWKLDELERQVMDAAEDEEADAS